MSRPGDTVVFHSACGVLRDVRRVYSANFIRREDVVFTEEDIASPEGFVFGCWGAILGRGRAVSRSLSLREDSELLERALLEQSVSHLSGRRRFYEAITMPLAVRSVKVGFVFGAIDPWDLRSLEEHLDIPLARAWSGLGRILAMSRPDPDLGDLVRHQHQRGRDPRSVGRLLPGIVGKVENGRLRIRVEPSEDAWVAGPRAAVIEPDGLLMLEGEGEAGLDSEGD